MCGIVFFNLYTAFKLENSKCDVFAALEKIKRPLYEKHPMAKFAWTVTEDTDTVCYSLFFFACFWYAYIVENGDFDNLFAWELLLILNNLFAFEWTGNESFAKKKKKGNGSSMEIGDCSIICLYIFSYFYYKHVSFFCVRPSVLLKIPL